MLKNWPDLHLIVMERIANVRWKFRMDYQQEKSKYLAVSLSIKRDLVFFKLLLLQTVAS